MPKTAAQPRPPAPGAIVGELPAAQAPQLCQLVTSPPDGPDWLTEIKFDGYRFIVSLNEGRVRLLTRKGLDWADRLPRVARAFARLPVTRPCSTANSSPSNRTASPASLISRRFCLMTPTTSSTSTCTRSPRPAPAIPRRAPRGPHCVIAWDYTGTGDIDTVRLGTWGTWRPTTWRWVRSRLMEAHALLWRQLQAVEGVDYDQLRADVDGFVGQA